MPFDCPKAPVGGPAPVLQTTVLRAGTRLVRFASAGSPHPIDSFNPNTGKDWTKALDGNRFNPFPAAVSGNVPTIYVADTFGAAALESVFHAVPHTPSPEYPRSQLAAWCYAELEAMKDFTIFLLTNPKLRQLTVPGRTASLQEAELIHSQGDEYPNTRTWAHYLHSSVKKIAGLGWRPRLGGQGTSYVLFGDRCGSDALKILSGPTAIDSGPGFMRIHAVAKAASIQIKNS